MGHSTADEYLRKAQFPGNVTADVLLRAAVDQWYDEEAGRYDDARPGNPKMYPVMTEHQRTRLFNYSEYGLVRDGQSAIFPIIAESDFIKKTRKIRVTVPGSVIDGLQKGNLATGVVPLNDIVLKQEGDSVDTIDVVKLPAKRKPVAVTTEGKTVTLYKIVGVFNDSPYASNNEYVLAESISSQAEARSKAIEAAAAGVTRNFRGAFDAIEVRPYQIRDTGDSAVVRVTIPVSESGTVEVAVTYATPKKNAEIIGWNVYFDYHH